MKVLKSCGAQRWCYFRLSPPHNFQAVRGAQRLLPCDQLKIDSIGVSGSARNFQEALAPRAGTITIDGKIFCFFPPCYCLLNVLLRLVH
jgi:hypothetical protein